MEIGILFNPRAFWVGYHFSRFNKRLCLNIIPMFTLWIVLEGGNVPKGEYA